MPIKRKYTNASFTKRVDHEAGRHRPPRAMSEPAVCEGCGATYANRRWNPPDVLFASGQDEIVQTVVCPACRQQRDGEPRGFVFVDGKFAVAHHAEIEQLLRNEAERAAVDNPLARIMDLQKRHDHELVVSTTTEHLAQRLVHALEKAFGGTARYDFSHENKLARVSWHRN